MLLYIAIVVVVVVVVVAAALEILVPSVTAGARLSTFERSKSSE